jgi:hypothetical protein
MSRVRRPPLDGAVAPAYRLPRFIARAECWLSTETLFWIRRVVSAGLLSHFEISEKDRSLRRRKKPELRYLLKTPERYMDRSKSSL